MDKDVFVHGQGSGRMSHKYRKIDQKDQTKAQTLPFEWLLRVSPLAWCQLWASLMLQLYLWRLDRFLFSVYPTKDINTQTKVFLSNYCVS